MIRIYYSNEEYEPNKRKILTFYSDRNAGDSPEDTSDALTDYSVLEIEERYNPNAHMIEQRQNLRAFMNLPEEFWVSNSGELVSDTLGIITINPNPQKEAYKVSALYGLTQAQLETYIDNNVTNLAEAKEFLKKMAAVMLWLVKQTRMDE